MNNDKSYNNDSYNNRIKVITMIKKYDQSVEKYDQSVEINYNPNWPYIPDHPYRVLFIGG